MPQVLQEPKDQPEPPDHLAPKVQLALILRYLAPLAPLAPQDHQMARLDLQVQQDLRGPQALLELLEIQDQQESHLLFLEHSIVLLIFFQSTQRVQETYLLLTGGLL